MILIAMKKSTKIKIWIKFEFFIFKVIGTLIEKFNGGPVGINTLATAVSENGETIEEVYEPFLIQEGFIIRTPRGRQVTEKAYRHLGKSHKKIQKGLF